MEFCALYFHVFTRVCFNKVAGCSYVFLLKRTQSNTENTKQKKMNRWTLNLDIKNC